MSLDIDDRIRGRVRGWAVRPVGVRLLSEF